MKGVHVVECDKTVLCDKKYARCMNRSTEERFKDQRLLNKILSE